MLDLRLWLDSNIELHLSHEAVEAVETALRAHIGQCGAMFRRGQLGAELETAANIIRAHLQHLPPKGVPLHHDKAPPEGFARGETGEKFQVFNPITDPLLG